MESSLERVLNGKYVLRKLLGQAGPYDMTYLAEDITAGNTPFIVREYFPVQLAQRVDNSTALQPFDGAARQQFEFGLTRFFIEDELAQSLDHPGIIKHKDFFKENGTGYLVSTFSRGGIPLDAFVLKQNTSPTFKQAYLFLREVISGLATAHSNGLLHGRLSPRQIMRSQDGKSQLMRFHMARTILSNHCNTLELDADTGYSSPEVTFGTGMFGPWSDVYSLTATILAITLRQRIPSAAERIEKDALLDVLNENNLTDIATRKIIIKALHLDPEERYRSINEFTEQLDNLYGLGSRPAAATPAVSEPPPSKPEPPSTPALDALNVENPAQHGNIRKKPIQPRKSDHPPVPSVAPAPTEPRVMPKADTTKKAQYNAPKVYPTSKQEQKVAEKSTVLHTVDIPKEPLPSIQNLKDAPEFAPNPAISSPDLKQRRPAAKERPPKPSPTILETSKKRDFSFKEKFVSLSRRVPPMVWMGGIGILSIFAITLMAAGLIGSDLNPNDSFIAPVPESASAVNTVSEIPYTFFIARGDSLYELAQLALYDNDSLLARRYTNQAWTLFEENLQPHTRDMRVQDYANRIQSLKESLAVPSFFSNTIGDESQDTISPFAMKLISEGDSLYALGDLEMARVKFQIAQEYLPQNSYASEMLTQIEEEIIQNGSFNDTQGSLQPAGLNEESSSEVFPINTLPLDNSGPNETASSAFEELATAVEAAGTVPLPIDSVAFFRQQAEQEFRAGNLQEARNSYLSALRFSPANESILARIEEIDNSLTPPEPTGNIDENGIYLITDTPPTLLPTSRASLSLNYPLQAKLRNIEGRVVMRMIINETGRVSDLSVIRGIGFGCDEEAMRIIQDALFEPATVNGSPVASWHNYAIMFRLAQE